jgi:hypothetical protein
MLFNMFLAALLGVFEDTRRRHVVGKLSKADETPKATEDPQSPSSAKSPTEIKMDSSDKDIKDTDSHSLPKGSIVEFSQMNNKKYNFQRKASDTRGGSRGKMPQ